MCLTVGVHPKVMISLVNDMLKLKNDFIQKIKISCDFLSHEYNLTKITKKIAKFYNFSWESFSNELNNQKIRLDINQKEKLFIWFIKKQKELKDLEIEINKIDYEIDQIVYKLYKITEDEIKTIEKIS